jgi:hypothetical protein
MAGTHLNVACVDRELLQLRWSRISSEKLGGDFPSTRRPLCWFYPACLSSTSSFIGILSQVLHVREERG